MELFDPIPKMSFAGDGYLNRLSRLGIKTISDLLFYFPFRYNDFSNAKKIADLSLGETATILGKISRVETIRTRKKHLNLIEATITDESGDIGVVWFGQSFLARNLKAGDFISLSGKIAKGPKGLYLQNPVYEKIGETEIKNRRRVHTGGLIAVYPETAGVTSRGIRYLVNKFVGLSEKIGEPLPAEVRERRGLMNIKDALAAIHFPKNFEEAERAKKRFAFEELFLLQLATAKSARNLKKEPAPEIKIDIEKIKKFVGELPFKLTDAQRKTAWEILQDLAKQSPMNRLLNGDVGSGKTVVAGLAAFSCVLNGYQAAFMAPTEILTHQHFESFLKLFEKYKDIEIGRLCAKSAKVGKAGNFSPIKKAEFLKKARNGGINIIIGTHSLIQKNAGFKKLGLAIVDEQHRFGVRQRAELLNSENLTPHFLSMSATPIPRTLALTVFGDLDISILNEMPKGRQKIITKIIPPAGRKSAYAFIREEIKKGRQIFVICPRIEKNGDEENGKSVWAEVKAVKDEYKKLSEKIFPDLKIAALHGKLKTDEKESAIKKFGAGEFDILVATSVVEVGIDVPNATVMMIEGADRFGLSQLHQFRGRVGRGGHQSYCLLFPTNEDSNQRLKAMIEYDDGFKLAQKDLEIRGPGSFFGGRQWGLPDLAMASLADFALIKAAREEAEIILQKDPELKNHPLLAEKLAKFAHLTHLE